MGQTTTTRSLVAVEQTDLMASRADSTVVARQEPGARTATGSTPAAHDVVEPAGAGLTAVVVGAALLPFAVIVVALIGTHWTPSGDVALEMLQVSDVAGRHNPLLGAWSRWGWNHPGPLLFYVLAPFTWLFGAGGALTGVAVLNSTSVIVAVVFARRRGGVTAAALVGLVGVLLALTLGPTLLIDPWNPWVGLFPLYAFVVLSWSVSERDLAALPYAVVAASFMVQAHVGFAPFVVGLGLTTAVLSWQPWGSGLRVEAPWPARRRRHVAASAVCAVVLWAPPVIQQLTSDPGNLALLGRFARHPPDGTAGWTMGWRGPDDGDRVPGCLAERARVRRARPGQRTRSGARRPRARRAARWAGGATG